jgi:hypothetical protein
VIVVVDLTSEPAAVTLAAPEDCSRFHVAVQGGDRQALAAALSSTGVGHLLPSGDVMVDTAALTRLARGRVPDGWDEQFAGMLAYAAGKGWVDDGGSHIQGHVEWES